MTLKGTVRRYTSTVLVLTTTLLAAGVGKAAGPADTNWMTYNGTVNGQRYSSLDQINVQNVASLAEVCRLQVDDSGTFQAGPLTDRRHTVYDQRTRHPSGRCDELYSALAQCLQA